MGESTKAVLALFAMLGVVASMFMWMLPADEEWKLWVRYVSPAVVALALGLLLWLERRRDRVPDYLRKLAGDYFNRDGFCFAFTVGVKDGVAYLDAYFQTQRDRPCVGRIALRPTSGWLGGRAKIDAVTFQVECPPAGFGVVRVPVPVPQKYQGSRQKFEVGASVRYPEGRGKRLRLHDGIFLRTNANFGKAFETALMVAGAAADRLVLTTPAGVTLQLPAGVADDVPDGRQPEVQTLWQLGDPPLPGWEQSASPRI